MVNNEDVDPKGKEEEEILFLDLLPEMRAHIVSYLPFRDLGALMSTCRELNKNHKKYFLTKKREQRFLNVKTDLNESGDFDEVWSRSLINQICSLSDPEDKQKLIKIYTKLSDLQKIVDTEEDWTPEFKESFNAVIDNEHHMLAPRIAVLRKAIRFLLNDDLTEDLNLKKNAVCKELACGWILFLTPFVFITPGFGLVVFAGLGAAGQYVNYFAGFGISSIVIGTGVFVERNCVSKSRCARPLYNFFRPAPQVVEPNTIEEPLFPGASANDGSEEEKEPLLITSDRYGNG